MELSCHRVPATLVYWRSTVSSIQSCSWLRNASRDLQKSRYSSFGPQYMFTAVHWVKPSCFVVPRYQQRHNGVLPIEASCQIRCAMRTRSPAPDCSGARTHVLWEGQRAHTCGCRCAQKLRNAMQHPAECDHHSSGSPRERHVMIVWEQQYMVSHAWQRLDPIQHTQ